MNQKGMTLVELLVVLVVASIIGIAVINMFTLSNRTFMDQNKVIDMQRDGRLVMDYITRTLREAGLNPLNSSSFEGIVEYAPGPGVLEPMIVIDRDLDLDGVNDYGSEKVGFALLEKSPGEKYIQRGFGTGPGPSMKWQDMASNVEDFILICYNSAGGITDVEEDIRSIDVEIKFKDEKSMGGDMSRSYKTRIDLRNF